MKGGNTMLKLTTEEIEYEKLLLPNNVLILRALSGNVRNYSKRLAYYNSKLFSLMLEDDNDSKVDDSPH
jgi:hypothetical protein